MPIHIYYFLKYFSHFLVSSWFKVDVCLLDIIVAFTLLYLFTFFSFFTLLILESIVCQTVCPMHIFILLFFLVIIKFKKKVTFYSKLDNVKIISYGWNRVDLHAD